MCWSAPPLALTQPDEKIRLRERGASGVVGSDEGFLAEYRRSGGRAKVIVISGAARADPIARDLVVDEFIGKPFDLERLLESVRRFAYG